MVYNWFFEIMDDGKQNSRRESLFMKPNPNHRFSGPVTIFHERALPEKATPAGYAALVDAYGLPVLLPRTVTAIGEHHKVKEESGWRLLTPRHAPSPALEGHLTFALKYEGLDLAILNLLFGAVDGGAIEALVRAKPTGSYARRIWFLYEWLTGRRLNLADAEKGSYVPVVDPEQQYATAGENSSRHRVRNNLPCTLEFCPLVFRTKTLEQFIATDLAQRAQRVVADVPRDLLARTAAFLLLKDSKSSYAIAGERAPQNRIQRWGLAIGEASRRPIKSKQLLLLRAIDIGGTPFALKGPSKARA